MPGASLWLIPPENHPLTPHLQELISNTLPPLLPGHSPSFPPHLTLTSNIPLRLLALDPNFLTTFPLPASALNPHVRFTSLVPSPKYFMKEVLYCWKDPSLLTLSTILRYEFADHSPSAHVHQLLAQLEKEHSNASDPKGKQTTTPDDDPTTTTSDIFTFINAWTSTYTPHVSLIYNDISYPLLVGSDTPWPQLLQLRETRRLVRSLDTSTSEDEAEDATLHDRIARKVEDAGIKFLDASTSAPPAFPEEGLIASFKALEEASEEGSADWSRARQLREEYESVLALKKAEFADLERWSGWKGGKIVLVDCEGPVEGWRVLAERELNNDGVKSRFRSWRRV
ncbi:hypothetical protein BJ508DRAFT_24980 [Ascobolus immersus RN42]|uniref:2',3'-cyclic-nucleotide 3'-phosphodiesterase n=1 Tax=Ascobolus immersus RN42 TaxID=1160509 RepID=A0A3N4HTB1_ASCIM|nr:hypothetical protein BJ508DRAFT_24980 [Ascobolus immersus RN42]